jgi:hypothetical protein
MTKLTNDQKDQVRTLVESFRDAAANDIANWDRGRIPQEIVDNFVKYDTWIKLDDAEQAREGKRNPFDHGPGRR